MKNKEEAEVNKHFSTVSVVAVVVVVAVAVVSTGIGNGGTLIISSQHNHLSFFYPHSSYYCC